MVEISTPGVVENLIAETDSRLLLRALEITFEIFSVGLDADEESGASEERVDTLFVELDTDLVIIGLDVIENLDDPLDPVV